MYKWRECINEGNVYYGKWISNFEIYYNAKLYRKYEIERKQ